MFMKNIEIKHFGKPSKNITPPRRGGVKNEKKN